MGRRGVDRNVTSFPSAGVRKLDSLSNDLSRVSPGSLQMERREMEAALDDEDIGGELEELLEACEEDRVEQEEEVWVKSRGLDSSREDGMHSHVSRSENLE